MRTTYRLTDSVSKEKVRRPAKNRSNRQFPRDAENCQSRPAAYTSFFTSRVFSFP